MIGGSKDNLDGTITEGKIHPVNLYTSALDARGEKICVSKTFEK